MWAGDVLRAHVHRLAPPDWREWLAVAKIVTGESALDHADSKFAFVLMIPNLFGDLNLLSPIINLKKRGLF